MTYTLGQIVISLIFWAWALANILRGQGFDLGVISFALSFIAGILGITSVFSKGDRQKLLANLHLAMTAIGHLIVTLNYLAGAIIGAQVSVGFQIYCAVFTGLWFLSTIVLTIWANQWRKVVKTHSYSHRIIYNN